MLTRAYLTMSRQVSLLLLLVVAAVLVLRLHAVLSLCFVIQAKSNIADLLPLHMLLLGKFFVLVQFVFWAQHIIG